MHYTRLHCTIRHYEYTTGEYATLHYITLHYTTLHYTTLHHTFLQLQLHYTNYTTLQLQLHYTTTTTTTALHHTTSSSCGWGDHCNHCNHFKKHNSNHLSVHQWIRSAIRDSQQPTSPFWVSYFRNFRHRRPCGTTGTVVQWLESPLQPSGLETATSL